MNHISTTEDGLFDKISRQFHQLVPAWQFQFGHGQMELLVSPHFQHRLYTEVFTGYPEDKFRPKPEYTLSILRKLIPILESHAEEVDECLLEMYIHLLSAPRSDMTSPSVVWYDLDPSTSVSLLESRSVISGGGTTGLRTWEAAFVLTQYLVREYYKPPGSSPSSVRVMELGAGTGLVGLAFAKKFGAHVVVTDGSFQVVQAMYDNIARNQLEELVTPQVLVWGSETEIQTPVDLVVGADVTYDAQAISALVDTVDMFANQTDPVPTILIAATVRNQSTIQAFESECEAKNLEAKVVYTYIRSEEDLFFYPENTPEIFIYQIS